MKSVAQKRKHFKHFTADERLILEYYLLGKNHFPKINNTKMLAEIFNKSRRSIQREIKRGLVEHLTTNLDLKTEYNAYYAQRKADYEKTGKGAPIKLKNDYVLVKRIEELIKNRKYSPYAVMQEFNLKSWPTKTRVCEKTIYNYISTNLLSPLTIKDLPNKGKKYRKKQKKKHFSRAACAIRSISNRAEHINDRREFGHWEIDTVKSCAKSTPQCILTLTERKTRAEIIRKMPNAESTSVVNEINKMENTMGKDLFKKVFKSITADGGSEFMDFDGIEKDRDGEKRTELYFAHPYCASERGTNENHNRMLRRFFPKGTNFSNINDEDIKDVQDWMNNYPRKILTGASPNLEIEKEIGFNLLL